MKEVQMKKFFGIKIGTLIRHKDSAHALVVVRNSGASLIAVRVQHVSNPDEWLILEEEKIGIRGE